MRKFRFPLDKLLSYRRGRLSEQQATLDRLLAGKAALEARRAAIEREERLVMDALRRMMILGAENLLAVDGFRRFAALESARLVEEIRQFASRIEAQRAAVVEARREVEVLERFREKRLNAWRQEVDRETERQVAELVIARWRQSSG